MLNKGNVVVLENSLSISLRLKIAEFRSSLFASRYTSVRSFSLAGFLRRQQQEQDEEDLGNVGRLEGL